MALAGLGPWNDITPSFFTSAMEAGARAGLSQRSQDEEQQSAADRLKLAYDQLASKEREESEQRRIQLRQIDAANALKAQQAAQLAQYRAATTAAAAARIQDAADQLTERRRHNLAMESKTTTPKGARIELPEDAETGDPKESGTMDDPEIARRVNAKRKAATDELLKAQQPGWLARMFGAKPVVPAKPAEVTRKTKDGKLAVFDANTKQFLRYADTNMGGDQPDNDGQ